MALILILLAMLHPGFHFPVAYFPAAHFDDPVGTTYNGTFCPRDTRNPKCFVIAGSLDDDYIAVQTPDPIPATDD